MRRFLLLLLAFVLPLQMSWAATHFCDDDLGAQVAVVDAEHREHAAQHAELASGLDKKSQQSDKLADACCGAAHGCHVLHHIMAQEDSQVPAASSAQLLSSPRDSPVSDGRLSRVERPKWPAA